MKKLITVVALIAGLAVGASGDLLRDYCANPELTLQNEVKNNEDFIKYLIPNVEGMSYLDRSSAVAKSSGSLNALPELLQNCGINSNLTLQLSNGTTVSISPNNIALSLATYIEYLSNFNLGQEMLTKYFLFVSRPTSSFMKNMGKVFIEENYDKRFLNSTYFVFALKNNQEKDLYTFLRFDPIGLIHSTYCYSNYRTDTIYGHLDIEFNEFLYSIIMKDYETANDILNDVFSTEYKSNASGFAKMGCKVFKILQ